MIEISQAAKSDTPLIQQIAHRTWPATFSTIISEGKMNYMLEMMYSIESLTEQVEKNGHCFILAKDNQKCVGFASYELNYKNSKTTKIHKLYILPETQGKGVGKNKKPVPEVSNTAYAWGGAYGTAYIVDPANNMIALFYLNMPRHEDVYPSS